MSSFDAKLAAQLEDQGEKLLQILKDAMDAEKRYSVECPRKCCQGNTFNAKFPDVRAQLEVAKWWTERAEGRAAQKPPKPEAPKAGGNLADLNDDELQAMLDADSQ